MNSINVKATFDVVDVTSLHDTFKSKSVFPEKPSATCSFYYFWNRGVYDTTGRIKSEFVLDAEVNVMDILNKYTYDEIARPYYLMSISISKKVFTDAIRYLGYTNFQMPYNVHNFNMPDAHVTVYFVDYL
ncbi:MAG: hypothetical protein BWY74_02807 [Firmicutes bacterium ADurb.Bin419]|nr:MAG: hypothetical protein BWY74_02807 [Firmicutes bacterium ADurb.Bin419]